MRATRESVKTKIRMSVCVNRFKIKTLEKVDVIIDDLFNEYESYIEDLKIRLEACRENNSLFFGQNVKFLTERDLLKQCVEEAIKRPMGVEPSIWSDYKMREQKVEE